MYFVKFVVKSIIQARAFKHLRFASPRHCLRGINNALNGTEDDVVWDNEEEEAEDVEELIDKRCIYIHVSPHVYQFCITQHPEENKVDPQANSAALLLSETAELESQSFLC